MLTQKQVKELFDYVPETGELIWKVDRGTNKTRETTAGNLRIDGRKHIQINRSKYLVHRLVFLYHHGYSPRFIDHIDKNPSNNRIENLRACTPSQNQGNVLKRSNNTSGYKGVHFNKRKQKWQAGIKVNNHPIYLGRSSNPIDAAQIYNFGAYRYFGEFASYNLAEQTCPLICA
jgi:hypothetical protein